jgi:hypothetical protein
MDHLRCKTPVRVRQEIWTHLLGYNLLRGVMAATAAHAGILPWCLSFKGTQQTVNAFLPMAALLVEARVIRVMLVVCAVPRAHRQSVIV